LFTKSNSVNSLLYCFLVHLYNELQYAVRNIPFFGMYQANHSLLCGRGAFPWLRLGVEIQHR
jgi:hypothetical protein